MLQVPENQAFRKQGHAVRDLDTLAAWCLYSGARIFLFAATLAGVRAAEFPELVSVRTVLRTGMSALR
jgi:hypothetical protein